MNEQEEPKPETCPDCPVKDKCLRWQAFCDWTTQKDNPMYGLMMKTIISRSNYKGMYDHLNVKSNQIKTSDPNLSTATVLAPEGHHTFSVPGGGVERVEISLSIA